MKKVLWLLSTTILIGVGPAEVWAQSPLRRPFGPSPAYPPGMGPGSANPWGPPGVPGTRFDPLNPSPIPGFTGSPLESDRDRDRQNDPAWWTHMHVPHVIHGSSGAEARMVRPGQAPMGEPAFSPPAMRIPSYEAPPTPNFRVPTYEPPVNIPLAKVPVAEFPSVRVPTVVAEGGSWLGKGMAGLLAALGGGAAAVGRVLTGRKKE